MPFTIGGGIDIPDGTYPATLEKVEEGESTFGKNRTWHWLVELEDRIESLSVFTSANTGPQSTAYKWLTALLGEAPKTGQTYEDPTGTRVLVQIIRNEKGYPKIAAVMPYTAPQQVMEGVPR